MRNLRIQTTVALPMLPAIPGWIRKMRAETLEDAAFRSGAVLAHLTFAATTAYLPLALWRDRLALAAAEVCVGFAGRREGAAALRDALHLTKAGDDPGPAGNVLRQWSQAVARPISVAALGRALDGAAPERIALCLDAVGQASVLQAPVDRAAQVMEAVLVDSPRAETAALILADAVLSLTLGQAYVLPLMSLAFKPRDLRMRGDDLRMACHRAVFSGAGQAVPLAADLARRAIRLQDAVPKLRAKAAGQAVAMFLAHDALTPGALLFMSDRAARRLCDRLVDLCVLRELTGRDTFRLYGV
jgi:hypothetical protein